MEEPIRYDLLHEPWIPCERLDGSRVLVGIEEALVEAHTFAAIHDESPLATATLHRLLLAILQQVFLPRKMEEWMALWQAAAFDASMVSAYLTKWKDRFNLFHHDRPFLQVANLREVLREERGKDPEATEAWRLSMESSAHSNATQLFEPLPREPVLSPARAAVALLGFLAFTPGGRLQNETDSWDAANVRGGAVVLIRGDTLHRTLLLNLLWQPDRAPSDIPPWERSRCADRTTRAPLGFVDQLVWQARRVQLLVEKGEDGGASVRSVVTAAGEQLDAEYPDPMFAYAVRDPKQPPVAIRVDRDRSVWRDAAALFDVATGAGQFRRPRACDQLAEIVREGNLPRDARLRVELLGLASNKASIRLWRADQVPLPQSLLVDGARVSILRSALQMAEDLGLAVNNKVLRILAENALAPSQREAHANDISNLRSSLGSMPSYWAALGQGFAHWLGDLGTADDLDATLAAWKRTLRATARDVVRDAEVRLGTGARALQAGAKAERALRRVLRDVLGDNSVVGATTAMGTTEGGPA
jgi:CRISPR system Cascade subunit CasA